MLRGKCLENYPVELLSDNSVLTVETNVSSYTTPTRGALRNELGTRSVYVLAKAETVSS